MASICLIRTRLHPHPSHRRHRSHRSRLANPTHTPEPISSMVTVRPRLLVGGLLIPMWICRHDNRRGVRDHSGRSDHIRIAVPAELHMRSVWGRLQDVCGRDSLFRSVQYLPASHHFRHSKLLCNHYFHGCDRCLQTQTTQGMSPMPTTLRSTKLCAIRCKVFILVIVIICNSLVIKTWITCTEAKSRPRVGGEMFGGRECRIADWRHGGQSLCTQSKSNFTANALFMTLLLCL